MSSDRFGSFEHEMSIGVERDVAVYRPSAGACMRSRYSNFCTCNDAHKRNDIPVLVIM